MGPRPESGAGGRTGLRSGSPSSPSLLGPIRQRGRNAPDSRDDFDLRGGGFETRSAMRSVAVRLVLTVAATAQRRYHFSVYEDQVRTVLVGLDLDVAHGTETGPPKIKARWRAGNRAARALRCYDEGLWRALGRISMGAFLLKLGFPERDRAGRSRDSPRNPIVSAIESLTADWVMGSPSNVPNNERRFRRWDGAHCGGSGP